MERLKQKKIEFIKDDPDPSLISPPGSGWSLKKDSTVMDMARAVHRNFAHNLEFARIWSKNKHDGQRVNRDCLLEDEDIIERHM